MEPKIQRVGIGVGGFHNPPRAKYSEETKNLIKIMMEESKLTMMQRKSIQDAVDRGEPLPVTAAKSKLKKETSAEAQVRFPSGWKRRTQDVITSSGAYEREQYRGTTASFTNKEKQKHHLACLMAYGKEMPPTPRGPKILHRRRKEPPLPNDIDVLHDLIRGIRERMDFLNEMESLGHGKKYRPIIQQEIAQKIRVIETMDKEKSVEIRDIVEKLKYEKPLPKPFPLGELDR